MHIKRINYLKPNFKNEYLNGLLKNAKIIRFTLLNQNCLEIFSDGLCFTIFNDDFIKNVVEKNEEILIDVTFYDLDISGIYISNLLVKKLLNKYSIHPAYSCKELIYYCEKINENFKNIIL